MNDESYQMAKQAIDQIENAVNDISDILINFRDIACTSELIQIAGKLDILLENEIESLREVAAQHDPAHGIDCREVREFLEGRET